jgi:ABC-type uncharacterized transport system involved in gliding motility auxiliary subunit
VSPDKLERDGNFPVMISSAKILPKEDEDDENAPTRQIRVVATGSSQFANNIGFQQRPEHLDLILNITNYLLQDENFIAIRPKNTERSNIDLASQTSQFLLMMICFIYPFLFLGLGILYWLRRRSA